MMMVFSITVPIANKKLLQIHGRAWNSAAGARRNLRMIEPPRLLAGLLGCLHPSFIPFATINVPLSRI